MSVVIFCCRGTLCEYSACCDCDVCTVCVACEGDGNDGVVGWIRCDECY